MAWGVQLQWTIRITKFSSTLSLEVTFSVIFSKTISPDLLLLCRHYLRLSIQMSYKTLFVEIGYDFFHPMIFYL